ncbi:sushi, von Willebrand factor type A, EGF and pentraxin domain-containing protein 1-like [Stylophora pistillata]|uniref:sushi, von Willebrand factor type A, EGF and pentraxin domain-containing protein 1-like n=1 Tax=Stylophora pistillata TaxID=50429 RepID=UPI000C05722B|nr:sushi, von Willebrand factor type A, EGF and pentraxin domain-containing protein 1-like [Stylophora pistillata]
MLLCKLGDVTSSKLCPPLRKPVNGFIHGQQNWEGEHISFSCKPGYWLNGSSERQCLSSGAWTGVQPTCEYATADYALLFPRKGTSDYVITSGMPSLTAVTVCFWLQTSDRGNEGVLFSYAVSSQDNELTLWDYRAFKLTHARYKVKRAYGTKLYFKEENQLFIFLHIRILSISANDGKWHHICVTWENTAGSWKLFKDGRVASSGTVLSKGHTIRGGGYLTLGQEQDTVGGGFDAGQSFIGKLAGVNIWDHVLSNQEITRMSQSCQVGVGDVFRWSEFLPHIKGSVKSVRLSC